MKVLFIDQYSELGGAQQCLLDLLPALAESGWHAHVLAPGNGPLLDRLRQARVDVSAFPALFDVAGSFDLVYVNGPRVLPAAAWAVGRRTPLLFHAHHYLGNGYAALLARWSLRYSAATVVACSRFAAEPLGRCIIVPNGTADMGYRQRRFEPGALRIGIIGRLSPEKGQAEFLRAAALLRDALPGARYVICGTPAWSSTAYANGLVKLAQGLPVEFLGWRDDIATVLDELDLLVISSRQEGMSRVMAEAFSAGVPVIAFPVRAIKDLIEDGQTGFLTADASPRALAGRILDVLSGDRSRLLRVAQNARQCWERQYGIKAYRTRLLELMWAAVRDHPAAGETAPPPRYIATRPPRASADSRID